MPTFNAEVKNAFDKSVPSISSILESSDTRKVIEITLASVFACLGLSETEAREVVCYVIKEAIGSSECCIYERNVHRYLDERGVISLLTTARQNRQSLIYRQIRDFIPPHSAVLDVGCGDGGLAKAIAGAGNRVSLCDVCEHAKVSSTGLPYALFSQGEPLPYDAEFDVVLMSSVLHHSDDPVALIADCARVLNGNGRLVVVESVYGVDPPGANPANQRTSYFMALDHEVQRLSSMFFDHLCNRVFRYSEAPAAKVNVPFNFNTPLGWNTLFCNAGFEVMQTVHLGVDHAYVALYHTLHALVKSDI